MMRKSTRLPMFCALALAVLSLSGCAAQAQAPQAPQNAATADVDAPVVLLKTPNDGIQPQAKMDSKGVLHLIYFKGKPQAGDIFYVRSGDNASTWSAPIRVNSQPGSAIAVGTIRGAQIAIGQDNSVHVAWNGSSSAEPKGAGGAPMLYSRLGAYEKSFGPQRNLITWAGGIDGGGALAADGKGDVFVAWHASAGAKEDSERAIYLARSTNNGATFEREKKISLQPTGACGCCQVRALVDSKGALYVLYRAAGQNVNRDSTLLVSTDAGNTFGSAMLQPWQINACPMSSYALLERDGAVRAAWETEEQIYTSSIQPASVKFSAPLAAPGKGDNRKHPTLAVNAKGEMLLAWTEGTGWNRGGSLVWQVYGKDGKPTGSKGTQNGVPTWGLLSAITRPDGSFALVY